MVIDYKENLKQFGKETATKKSIYKPYIICSVNLITSVKEVGLINDQLLKLRWMKFKQFLFTFQENQQASCPTIKQAGTDDSAENEPEV